MQKHVNLVDLVKSFPTNIFLQNLASIQKRTRPIKFAHLAEKSEKGSISNLSTKWATPIRTNPRGCRSTPVPKYCARITRDMVDPTNTKNALSCLSEMSRSSAPIFKTLVVPKDPCSFDFLLGFFRVGADSKESLKPMFFLTETPS